MEGNTLQWLLEGSILHSRPRRVVPYWNCNIAIKKLISQSWIQVKVAIVVCSLLEDMFANSICVPGGSTRLQDGLLEGSSFSPASSPRRLPHEGIFISTFHKCTEGSVYCFPFHISIVVLSNAWVCPLVHTCEHAHTVACACQWLTLGVFLNYLAHLIYLAVCLSYLTYLFILIYLERSFLTEL